MSYTRVKLRGIEYLEYYLSNEYPTIKEIANKYEIKVESVKAAINAVVKKYSDKEYDFNPEYISRKELKAILDAAKEALEEHYEISGYKQ